MGPQGQGGYPQQQGEYSYQGRPQYGNDAPNSGPAYYDATQTAGSGKSLCSEVNNLTGYQPPAFPPPASKAR
jgi:hypothetical protein